MKRKLGFYICYLGTKYHGQQLQSAAAIQGRPKDAPELKCKCWPRLLIVHVVRCICPYCSVALLFLCVCAVIDSEVASALFRSGMIDPNNYSDLSKISWKRSSRTDKGVHSCGTFISAKLLLPYHRLDQLQTIPAEINAQLPDDIRVVSMQKLQRSFNAHIDCRERQYEYLLPAHVIPTSALPRLQSWCNIMSGNLNFHNYTNQKLFAQRKRDIKKAEKRKQQAAHRNDKNNGHPEGIEADNMHQQPHEDAPLAADAEADADDADADVDADADEVDDVSEDSSVSSAPYSLPPPLTASELLAQREEEIRTFRTRQDASTYRNILQFKWDMLEVDDVPFIRFTIRAESFVYHQIRMMIGTLIAASRGVIPGSLLPATLTSPFSFSLPVAPSGYLLLDYHPHAFDVIEPQLGNRLFQSNRPVQCSAEEQQTLREFKEKHIYQHIAARVRAGEDKEVLDKFLLHLDAHQVPDAEQVEQLYSTWSVQYAAERAVREQRRAAYDAHQQQLQQERETLRLARKRERLAESAAHSKANTLFLRTVAAERAQSEGSVIVSRNKDRAAKQDGKVYNKNNSYRNKKQFHNTRNNNDDNNDYSNPRTDTNYHRKHSQPNTTHSMYTPNTSNNSAKSS